MLEVKKTKSERQDWFFQNLMYRERLPWYTWRWVENVQSLELDAW